MESRPGVSDAHYAKRPTFGAPRFDHVRLRERDARQPWKSGFWAKIRRCRSEPIAKYWRAVRRPQLPNEGPRANPEMAHRRTARGERGHDKAIGPRSPFCNRFRWRSSKSRT